MAPSRPRVPVLHPEALAPLPAVDLDLLPFRFEVDGRAGVDICGPNPGEVEPDYWLSGDVWRGERKVAHLLMQADAWIGQMSFYAAFNWDADESYAVYDVPRPWWAAAPPISTPALDGILRRRWERYQRIIMRDVAIAATLAFLAFLDGAAADGVHFEEYLLSPTPGTPLIPDTRAR